MYPSCSHLKLECPRPPVSFPRCSIVSALCWIYGTSKSLYLSPKFLSYMPRRDRKPSWGGKRGITLVHCTSALDTRQLQWAFISSRKTMKNILIYLAIFWSALGGESELRWKALERPRYWNYRNTILGWHICDYSSQNDFCIINFNIPTQHSWFKMVHYASALDTRQLQRAFISSRKTVKNILIYLGCFGLLLRVSQSWVGSFDV